MRARSRHSWLGGLLALAIAGSLAPAFASVPLLISTEGLLLDEDGIPQEGPATLDFAIYDVEEGGEPLWSESHDVMVIAGYYRVLLGELDPFEGVFDADRAYLGVTIGDGAELAPRHPMGSVPFAIIADNATGDITPSSIAVDGLPVIDASGNWVGPALSLRTSLLEVDGEGSGLDADALDGLDSSELMRVDAFLDADELDGLDSTDFMRADAYLDADELDGLDSTDFMRADAFLDADELDGLDSTKFMRVDRDTGTSGALSVSGTTTMRREGTALQLHHTDSGGHVKMLFHSRVNEGSDKGFLVLQDDSAQTVGASNEDSRFVLGSYNDGGGAPHSDELWIASTGRMVQNVGRWDAELDSIIGVNSISGENLHHEWRINNAPRMRLNPSGTLHVANSSASSWTWSAIGASRSLELGQDGEGSVGSIKLNSYAAGQFVFLRPSNGNYHIDSTTGHYYYNWDEGVRGANHGTLHMADEAGAETVHLASSGHSWFSGGNVGVGTTGPASTLHIAGGDNAIRGSFGRMLQSRDEWLRLNDDDEGEDHHTSGILLDGPGVGTQGKLAVGTSSWSSAPANGLYVAGASVFAGGAGFEGDTGIGTAAPEARLHVHKARGYNGTALPNWEDRATIGLTGTYPHVVIASSQNNPNHAGTLSFWHNNDGGATTSQWNMGASDVGLTIGYCTNNTNPHCGLENNGTPSALSIESNGNVGIGTLVPASKLHIAGGDNAIRGSFGRMLQSRDEWLRVNDDDEGQHHHTAGIYLDGPGVGTQGRLAVGSSSWSAAPDGGLYVAAGAYLNGDTGIGTTSPGSRLQVHKGLGYNGTSLPNGADRATLGVTGNYPHIVVASSMNNGGHAGTLSFWHNNSSGGTTAQWNMGASDAGLTIGYCTNNWNPHCGLEDHAAASVLSLESNGNVGIGTLGPTSRLHVVGGDQAIRGAHGRMLQSRDEWLRINDDDQGEDYHTEGIYLDGPGVGTQGKLAVGTSSWSSAPDNGLYVAGASRFAGGANFEGDTGIGTASPGSRLHVHKALPYNGTALPNWADRATIGLTGDYPHVVIASSKSNVSHAGTLSFWHNNNGGGTTTQWNMGASDNGLTIGYTTNNANPHCALEDACGIPSILSLESNGNVGVGTISPAAKLDVMAVGRSGSHPGGKVLYASGSWGTGQSKDGGVEFRHTNATQGIGFGYNTIYQTGTNANQELNLRANGSGPITLNAVGDATGGVGVGIASPGSRLQVHHGLGYNGTALPNWADRTTLGVTGEYPHIVIASSQNNPNHAGTLSFWHNNNRGGTTTQWNMGASDAGLTIGYATNNTNPHCGLEDACGIPSILSLESNGNVGIGTLGPTSRLHVVGGDQAIRGAHGRMLQSRDEWLRINDDDQGQDYHTAGIYLDGPGVGMQSKLAVGTSSWSSAPASGLYVAGGAYINGKVGIGTTNPATDLDVNGVARFTSMRLQPLANPPGNPVVGSVYLDEETKSLMVYNGEDWASVGGGASKNTIGGAYGAWNNVSSGVDATTALPYPVNYTKKEAGTVLQVTLSSNLRTHGGGNICVRWAIRVNGNQCSPKPVNGNVYIAPGGNYHQHRTITGICTGVGAGVVTVQPYVENCPGYGVADAHTGWNSSTFLIVEEKRTDKLAFQAVEQADGRERGWLPYEVNYAKKESDSLLKLQFSSNLRTNGGAGVWCRWHVKVNDADCAVPITGAKYINPAGNYHQHHTITGMCPDIRAGAVRVRTSIDDGNGDCYTGWNSTTSLIVEEMPADGSVGYTAMPVGWWGHDATQALPISLNFAKTEASSLLKLTFNSSLRVYPHNNICCRWSIRVNGAQCPAVPINGNVYISPGGDPHHVRTIVGICPGLAAGNHTIQPWVEHCPGYGQADCYTSWHTSSTLIAEEMSY